MARQISRRSALQSIAGTGALGLSLAACGQKDSKDTLLPVKVLSSDGIQVITIQRLMNTNNYFQNFGLDASTLQITSGTNITGPLLSGEGDICIFAGFSQLLVAIEKGAALKIVGAASVKGQQALFSKNPEVQHVKDHDGRTVWVGAIGAQSHQVVSALLKKKGVDLTKIQFVNVGSSGDTFRAVAAGKVDAGNGQADVLASLEKYGVHMIQDGEYATELPEYTWQAAFTSHTAIRDKREALIRTLAAYCKVFRYVQHPGSKDDFVKAQIAALTPKDIDEATTAATSQWNYLQQRKIYAEDLVLSEERVDWMQELNLSLGNQKTKLPYNQLVDLSLAKEAVARLT